MVEYAPKTDLIQDEKEAKIYYFLVNHKVDSAELFDVARLTAEISLRNRYSLKYKPQTDQLIIMHLANSLYLSSKYLELPTPNKVGFIEGKRGIPSEDKGRTYVAADSSTPIQFPDGLINFSPYTLKQNVIDALENELDAGIGLRNGIFTISGLASHEMYHVRQRKDPTTSPQLDKDINTLEKKGLKSWAKTKSEKQAVGFEESFGKAYIKALPIINPLN